MSFWISVVSAVSSWCGSLTQRFLAATPLHRKLHNYFFFCVCFKKGRGLILPQSSINVWLFRNVFLFYYLFRTAFLSLPPHRRIVISVPMSFFWSLKSVSAPLRAWEGETAARWLYFWCSGFTSARAFPVSNRKLVGQQPGVPEYCVSPDIVHIVHYIETLQCIIHSSWSHESTVQSLFRKETAYNVLQHWL